MGEASTRQMENYVLFNYISARIDRWRLLWVISKIAYEFKLKNTLAPHERYEYEYYGARNRCCCYSVLLLLLPPLP